MPVESKMAVGFWQMQTFEMAVRKGGFVPDLDIQPLVPNFGSFADHASPTPHSKANPLADPKPPSIYP